MLEIFDVENINVDDSHLEYIGGNGRGSCINNVGALFDSKMTIHDYV